MRLSMRVYWTSKYGRFEPWCFTCHHHCQIDASIHVFISIERKEDSTQKTWTHSCFTYAAAAAKIWDGARVWLPCRRYCRRHAWSRWAVTTTLYCATVTGIIERNHIFLYCMTIARLSRNREKALSWTCVRIPVVHWAGSGACYILIISLSSYTTTVIDITYDFRDSLTRPNTHLFRTLTYWNSAFKFFQNIWRFQDLLSSKNIKSTFGCIVIYNHVFDIFVASKGSVIKFLKLIQRHFCRLTVKYLSNHQGWYSTRHISNRLKLFVVFDWVEGIAAFLFSINPITIQDKLYKAKPLSCVLPLQRFNCDMSVLVFFLSRVAIKSEEFHDADTYTISAPERSKRTSIMRFKHLTLVSLSAEGSADLRAYPIIWKSSDFHFCNCSR